MYIDLVLCKVDYTPELRLFEAPRFTHLEEGDKCIVDTYLGEKIADVVKSITVDYVDSEYEFIKLLAGVESLRRVKQKFAVRGLDYSYLEEEKEHESVDSE